MLKKIKKFQKGMSVFLITALVITGVTTPMSKVYADKQGTEVRVKTDSFIVEKISNKDRGQGEFDGLIEGGDRYNSYAWCMAARGDKLYIGTIRGLSETIIGTVIKRLCANGLSKEQAYALIDAITNNDFGHEAIEKGGDIISYDRKTGEMKVLATGEVGTSYRMAINYNGDIYIGSYSGTTNNIFRIDQDENIEKVYETTSGTSMRAACEYEGNLYFGGVDSTEELTEEYENAAKLAILKMDKDNPSKWDRVADFSDFDPIYAKDPAVKNQIASPIWDIVSYDGYIYATLPYSHGFIVYKGRPAVGEESQNTYGWHWEEVVGLKNGINNVALADQVEGYTGDAAGNLSMTATPFVYQDKLYLMDFDNTLGSMTTTLNNLLNPTTADKGKILNTMYLTLSHPQSLWVLDKKTEKFKKVEKFSKLMEGTCNEYLWRTAEYDGELYITTMDSSVIYRYLTQYTDLGADKENLKDKAKSIVNIAKAMKAVGLDESEDENIQKIAKIVIALASMIEKSSERLQTEEVEKVNKEYNTLLKQLDDKAKAYLEGNEKIIPVIKASQNSLLSQENLENLLKSVLKNLDEVDWQILYMYNYIASHVNSEVQGFDMFKTSDGVNFTVVTKDGFGDRYNYGGRTLQTTEDGLYVGTSNPFYGAQLFKLTNIRKEPQSEDTTTEVEKNKRFKVNKTRVVIAPEKIKKVAYTLPSNSKAKVKATSSNKKLVKVKVKAGVIEIKAKKATHKKRGSIVKVTVQAGNEKKVIKVAIKNSAKKLSAKKKVLSVKKGQTVKMTFKVVKAQNSNKAVTNLYAKKAKVAAKIKEIATVKHVKVKKGKIIVTIVAKKKGSAKLKLKLSEKVKASAKIIVK